MRMNKSTIVYIGTENSVKSCRALGEIINDFNIYLILVLIKKLSF